MAILHHILLSNFVYAPEKYRKITDNPWFYVWVSDCVVFSIYAYAWDVRQDFDLWDCKAQVNTKCLRDELIYESKVSKQTLLFISMRKIAWLIFFWNQFEKVNPLIHRKNYGTFHRRYAFQCLFASRFINKL